MRLFWSAFSNTNLHNTTDVYSTRADIPWHIDRHVFETSVNWLCCVEGCITSALTLSCTLKTFKNRVLRVLNKMLGLTSVLAAPCRIFKSQSLGTVYSLPDGPSADPSRPQQSETTL
jgi:hypothetical protein